MSGSSITRGARAGQTREPTRHRTVALAIRVALCLLVHGCANVDGGAVELSWKLRASSGSVASFVDCDSSGNIVDPSTGTPFDSGILRSIRVHWEVGAVVAFKDFPCRDGHGVTGFDLPPGKALISVSPVCANVEVNPATYTAPAPEQRTVNVGDTISLGAVELVLAVEQCDPVAHPCICQ